MSTDKPSRKKVTVTPMHTFLSHISEENITRLTVSLIERGRLTSVESTLADAVIADSNVIPIK